MLKCTKCLKFLPDDSFTFSASAAARRQRHYWCRDCNAAHYRANKDRHKMSVRANNIRKRYGLTVDQYDDMIAKGCEVCGERTKRVVVDHCHDRNVVRGPLCDGCNLAIGGAKDSPSTLRALAAYVERHMSV